MNTPEPLKLSDEASCLRHLIRMRWPNGVFCPKCSRVMHFKRSRSVFQCHRCAKELSPTAGTIFHKSKLPLTSWFQAMHIMIQSSENVSARELQRRLNLRSYRAAWLLAQKIRTAMTLGREAMLYKTTVIRRDSSKAAGKRGNGGSHMAGPRNITQPTRRSLRIVRSRRTAGARLSGDCWRPAFRECPPHSGA